MAGEGCVDLMVNSTLEFLSYIGEWSSRLLSFLCGFLDAAFKTVFMALSHGNPEEVFQLRIDSRQHQLWLISLKTDRTIIPKEHDQNSTDGRKLGVRVLF